MSEYPLLGYHFQVEWGGTRLGFTEVFGLDIEFQLIEYREGIDVNFSTTKMPGIPKYSNIILKRGIVAGDNEFFDWLKTIKLNQVERRDITISLLNENHEPVMVWKVKNAFPIRIIGPSLKAIANEVAIETLEVAHEGLIIENAEKVADF